MMRHLVMSNLFASKVHEIVLFLIRTGEREFVASTSCTEAIETENAVFTSGIRYKAV